MPVSIFLPGIQKRGTLEKVKHCSEVAQCLFISHEGSDPWLVMIFKTAHFNIVVRIGRFLQIQRFQPQGKRRFFPEISVKNIPDIVIVFHVKGCKHLAVRAGIMPLNPVENVETAVHSLRQPDTVRVNLCYSFSRLLPEIHRNQGCHVAAETIHDFCPHPK